MSSTTHSPTGLNGDRIAQRGRETLENISQEFQQIAVEEPASAYDRSFWRALQGDLVETAGKYRIALVINGHEAATEFRDIEDISARTAVEQFRGRVQDNPYRIQEERLWDAFRVTLLDANNVRSMPQ